MKSLSIIAAAAALTVARFSVHNRPGVVGS
jgi:hypothetical protein